VFGLGVPYISPRTSAFFDLIGPIDVQTFFDRQQASEEWQQPFEAANPAQ
jgi:hypothetical protein